MKKLVIAIVVIVSFIGVNAQVKGQLERLKELGEGTEFKAYWGIYKDDDGKFTGKAYKAIRVLEFRYNMHKKLTAFSMKDKETGKTIINRGFGGLKPNHYTQPSVFHIEGQNKAWLYIDGLFYMLKSVSDPSNITNVKIDYILVLEVEKVAEKSGEKKKMTMKEKIAATKAKMSASSGGAPKEITERDHEAIIKKYLADMKSVQEKATANFTAAEKKEIEEIENTDAASLAKRQSQSRELANKMNERDAKEGKKGSNYTVKNTSGSSVKIITDSGSTTTLSAGGSTTYACITNVFLCVGENSKGSIIANGEDACGKTIEF